MTGRRESITIARDRLDEWAGYQLTDAQLVLLEECIPRSSIPEAVAEICAQSGFGMRWETAGTGEPLDVNADSDRVHGYWALGPGPNGPAGYEQWGLTLVLLDDQAEVIAEHSRAFPTDKAAREYVGQVERGELPLPQGSGGER